MTFCNGGPNNPPTGKRALKRMIRELQPSSCGIEVDLQAALLIVSSDGDRGGIQRHLEHRPIPAAIRRPD